MRRLVPILVLVALAALAAVALAQVGSAPGARPAASAATGSFEVTNSDDGQAIFAAKNLAPGGSAVGTVTIEDTGSAAANLLLRRGDVVDSPGLGGGVLSERLRLTVVDVTVPGAPRTVYSGPLAAMPDQSAGELEPGGARTFEFTATLPDAGEASFQNAVQGASATVAYDWIAAEADGGGGGSRGRGSPGGAPTGEGGVASRHEALDLTVANVDRMLRSDRLVVWTRCDETCRLTVRGRLRASADGHHRGTRISFTEKHLAAPGAQRMRIPIPRRLRAWLLREPSPERLRAKLRFIAVGTEGGRDVVRKKVRVWVRWHQAGPPDPSDRTKKVSAGV
jgi:hypothetical protein